MNMPSSAAFQVRIGVQAEFGDYLDGDISTTYRLAGRKPDKSFRALCRDAPFFHAVTIELVSILSPRENTPSRKLISALCHLSSKPRRRSDCFNISCRLTVSSTEICGAH